MLASCRHFYFEEGARGIKLPSSAPQAPEIRNPQAEKQVQGRCARTCSVALVFSTNPNASANAAPSFAVPRLLLQPTPKSRISFFRKKCLHPRIASDIVLTRFSKKPRGCGGIGRRVRFRSVWGQPHEGSSPFTRTTYNLRPGVHSWPFSLSGNAEPQL